MPVAPDRAILRDVEQYTVGAAIVRGLLGGLSAIGLDMADLLSGAGLDVAVLEDPDTRIPEIQLLSVWLAAEQRWRGELLGLHAGSNTPRDAFEVLDHVTAAAPSVAEAFRGLARYFSIANTGMRFTIDETGADEVVVSMVHPYALELLPPGFVEYLWAVVVTRLRRENGDRVRTTVAFRHSPLGERPTYARILGAVVFEASRPGLRIPRDQWNLENPSADVAVSSALEREAREWVARLPTSQRPLDRVRAAITESLREGTEGIESTAPRLGLSVRSLQRELAAEGYTYTRAVDEIRQMLAYAYLSSTVPSLSEVSYLLGFSEPSAFHRAFRRWTGRTPLEYRNESWGAKAATDRVSTRDARG